MKGNWIGHQLKGLDPYVIDGRGLDGLDPNVDWKGWTKTTIGRDAVVVDCSDCRCRLFQSMLLIQGIVDGRVGYGRCCWKG